MSSICKNEFNAQMQAMQSRVDNLEINVQQQMLLSIQQMITLAISFATMTVESAAKAKFLTDPFTIAMLAGYIDRGAYDTLMGMLTAIPGADYLEELFTDLVLAGIGIPPYGAGIISTVMAGVSATLVQAQQALADALAADPPVPGDIANATAALAAAQQAVANAGGMFTALNNVSACKVAGHVFQAAVL